MGIHVKARHPLDPEWDDIEEQFDIIDQYLRVQNLRRDEEDSFRRIIERGCMLKWKRVPCR